MAKPIKVIHNIDGHRAVRNAAGTMANNERIGASVLAAAGGTEAGFRMRSRNGKSRHRVTVAAVTNRAKLTNAKHNTLIRALDAGRG